jgi:hypothetical protein
VTRLKWGDQPPMYDMGVDRGVLYLDGVAVPWNGLVSVDEKATGGVDTDHYFDGNRVHISQEAEDFEATISAYTYPDAFAEYNGYSERNEYRRFGFSYRTQHADNFKIHLVYNVLVRDDSRTWVTDSDSPQPSLFAWDIYGAAVPVPGASPAARLTMEAPSDPSVLGVLEDILYGTTTTQPRLPYPAELVELYEAATLLRVTYNADGTYTASGPDSMVHLLEDGQFEINAPTAFLVETGLFTVNSY